MDRFCRQHALGLMLAAALLIGSRAAADTIVIDSTSGSIYDGILDGFPLPPPGTTPDGVGDAQGNSLAVSLQTGVTEERGVTEFPLDDLAGLTASDITNATLTFNIDDVISTFGPGTTFDGTAAQTIFLFSYSGNGVIQLSDFANVVGAPLAVVDTTPFGVITDATLAVSGPIVFNIDVTTAVKNLVTAAATDMGIVFATNDSPTGTSLDNLGVPGAQMPFLTITTGPGDPPVFTPAALGCQKAIGKAGNKYVAASQKTLAACLDSVLKDVSQSADLAKTTEKCTAQLNAADASSKLGKAIAKFNAKVTDKCTGVTPADIGSPCDAGAADIAAVASCLLAQHQASAEGLVRAAYADACALITAVALQADFPVLCAP